VRRFAQEDLFKAFSIALKMPKGWYGDEEYAPNANAFLEYLAYLIHDL
jgi:hypothetical protein